jgi:hypothetical protein
VTNVTQVAHAVAVLFGWRRVHTGLTLVLMALYVWCGVLGLAVIGAVVHLVDTGGAAAELIRNAILATQYVPAALLAVGIGFCVAVPEPGTPRVLSVASLALAVGAVAADLMILIVSALFAAEFARALPGAAPHSEEAWKALAVTLSKQLKIWNTLSLSLSALYMTLFAAQILVFLLFMRATAEALRAAPLVASVTYLSFLYGVIVVLSVFGATALVFSPSAARGTTQALGVILLLLAVVLAVTVLSWFIVCLYQLRGAIARQLAHLAAGN